MLDFGFYNMNCMQGMKEFPDNYFDLAIVDPIYGDATKGGYTVGKGCEHLAKRTDYHLSLWQQEKTGSDYFKELFRVSKNQIVWGGNYFTDNLPQSQGWIVWDKLRPEGVGFADFELAWTSFNKASRVFRYMWNGMMQQDMAHKEKRIHPTQKPVALYTWILNKYANKDDIILDTHVGSASSLIACHRTNHKFVGFELDECYYKLANQRLKDEMSRKKLF